MERVAPETQALTGIGLLVISLLATLEANTFSIQMITAFTLGIGAALTATGLWRHRKHVKLQKEAREQ